jgi:hypothetical protein
MEPNLSLHAKAMDDNAVMNPTDDSIVMFSFSYQE